MRVLARAVARLLGCLSRAWRQETAEAADAQDAFATMRTLGGRFRLRGLPLCPQTAFADQSARDEVSAIAPGLWQSNWRGAERVAELAALGIDRVICVLPHAEAGENPFPETFRSAPTDSLPSDDRVTRMDGAVRTSRRDANYAFVRVWSLS